MKLFLSIIVFVALVCPPHPHNAFKLRPHSRISEMPQVVLITSPCSRCSGFVVANGFVATAAHCASFKGERLDVTFTNGKTEQFTVVVFKKNFRGFSPEDVAILKGPTLGIHPIPLVKPHKGAQWCVTMGWGGELGKDGNPVQRVSLCRLDDKHYDRAGLIAGHGEVDHGDSGGPTLIDRGAIGLNESIAAFDLPLFWSVPSSSISAALREAQEAAHKRRSK